MYNNQFIPMFQSIKISHKYLFSNQHEIMRFAIILYVRVSEYNMSNSFIGKKIPKGETNSFLQIKWELEEITQIYTSIFSTFHNIVI